MIWKAVVFGTGAFIAGVLGMWAADQQPPVTRVDAEVITQSVAPGDKALVRFKINRDRVSCGVRVDRFFFDSQNVRYVLGSLEFESLPGPIGSDTYVVEVPVPRSSSQGKGQYVSVGTYFCNPIHVWFWPIKAPPLRVDINVAGPPAPEQLVIPIPGAR